MGLVCPILHIAPGLCEPRSSDNRYTHYIQLDLTFKPLVRNSRTRHLFIPDACAILQTRTQRKDWRKSVLMLIHRMTFLLDGTT
jgi:hypothetical protein